MKKGKDKYVLDSYAVLAFLKEEPGWEAVNALLHAAERQQLSIYLNYVNLGEIYYAVYRDKGPVLADRAVSLIKRWPVKLIEVRQDMAISAGRVKAENKLSYADAYVVATALLKKARVLTGDEEFTGVEDLIGVEWLPPNR